MSYALLSAPAPAGAAGGYPAPNPQELTLYDPEQRLEDWLAGYLEYGEEGARSWRKGLESMLERSPLVSKKASWKPRKAQGGRAEAEWKRLTVVHRKKVTIIRFRNATLLREDDLGEAIDELNAIVSAGYHRIILSFAGIQRMSSQIATALASAYRRCEAIDGGQLRICGLIEELREAVTLTGLSARIPTFPDEAAALTAPWPEPKGPRVLPLRILEAMRNVYLDKESTPAPEAETRPDAEADAPALWLGMQGPEPRSVLVADFPFDLGREPSCGLTIDHPMVSRRHARIERRDGILWLLDLGTTNGTRHNGRYLRGRDIPLNDGDRIQIGPMAWIVAFGECPDGWAPPAEDAILGWLRDDEEADDGYRVEAEGATEERIELPSPDDDRAFKAESIEDVLIVTPLTSELDDEDAVGPLREGLLALFEGSHKPHRLVINLDHVHSLSSRAIAMLLAHNLRLERAGGALRLCQPSARVLVLLEHVRVPALVNVHAALEDAVLTAWA
ncbi:MAG: FHA domain-containing protein [Isosphaeraceae bacterium]